MTRCVLEYEVDDPEPEDHVAFDRAKAEKQAKACREHLVDLRRHGQPLRSLDLREGVARMLQPEPRVPYSSPAALCSDLTRETASKWAVAIQ